VGRDDLSMTFLISPTTSEERIRLIDRHTNSFIYAVSASSTTGAKKGFSDDQLSYFKRINKLKLKSPVMIGFGISSHETFKVACEHSTGAIIGSAFINMLKESTDLEADIIAFIKRIKGA
jgi:tryptophan synthase alpha chain